MNKSETEILIIGGGAAGLAAAVSASDKKVLVVDDNPRLGGQIWRAELGKIKSPEARELVEKIEQKQVSILNNATVFGQKDEQTLLAETPKGTVELNFAKLIIATGARERFLPFPNWTLPNIFGAGGLQALVKNGLSVENKRVVIAGTGALLLVVAEYLKFKGAKVLLIAEQTSQVKLAKFGFGLITHPKKIAQAISLKTKLFGVKYLTDCYIKSAEGKGKLEAVNLTRNGKTWRVECDMLACGFHLVPNVELAQMLGCKVENGSVKVDEFQQTSTENIFCAGEPTGIGGVEKSLIEGKIAGFSVTENFEKAKAFFAERLKTQRFADVLNETFALRDELKNLPDAQTIVCRCEDVRFGDLKNYASFREAKLQTRCGMGSCQGRICGAATEFLFNWKNDSVRPPIFPVKLENL
ncbi:MAG: NAD(P)/FAD-dependent oxidoreductase [Pyrinomonadaceae bacterium]|nr:NAD(P)/FAD-dependent oxidoreductase [Pyrinomonadaceae bacterium]